MSPIDLNSSNADYLEALYQRYQADPASVDPEWAAFFRGFDYGYLRAEEEEEGEGSTAAAAPAGRPPEPAVPPPAQPAPAVLEDEFGSVGFDNPCRLHGPECERPPHAPVPPLVSSGLCRAALRPRRPLEPVLTPRGPNGYQITSVARRGTTWDFHSRRTGATD